MIRILYFGQIAEAVGKSEELVDAKVFDAGVRAYFETKYPVLVSLSYRIAIDREIREELLAGEQPNEISLLPPFAGG